MTENLQPQQTSPQQANPQNPFSPLQTGCAFVMLSNMLIYLGVVAFTFNLLDPSKINADYLAKRGLSARPAAEQPENKDSTPRTEQKYREGQKIPAVIHSARFKIQEPPSPAVEMSEIRNRPMTTSRPAEPAPPQAALIERSPGAGGSAPSAASSRQFSFSAFPQITLPKSYSPIGPLAPRIITAERYETIPVELAPAIVFPSFNFPSPDSVGAYLYTPPNPVPEATRGGLRLSAPPVGAQSLYTNRLDKSDDSPGSNPPAKDRL